MIQLKLIDTYWPLIIPAITTPVVVFVMYFLLSRYIVEGVSLGSVKGCAVPYFRQMDTCKRAAYSGLGISGSRPFHAR